MKSIPKIVGVMVSSFLLCLGQSIFSASAANDMNAGQSAERMGGQAGRTGHLEEREGVAGLTASVRIGGQAGLAKHLEKQERVADLLSADVRMGGQAGVAGHLEERVGVVGLKAGVRIGGQAGLASHLEEQKDIAHN